MIERAKTCDAAAVAALAIQMWEENEIDELAAEFKELIVDEECALFLEKEDGRVVGFAQCQLRHDYVEGTDSSPVGYLEGIFVSETHRRQGVAKALLSACEEWAREMGCSEFASDCELTNDMSLVFHLALGFKEVNRVINFVKPL